MRSLANIEYGVKTLSVVFIVVIVCNLATLGFAYIYTDMFVEKQNNKIYALTGRTPVMIALGQNVKENREAEARAEILDIHNLFFAINPDHDEIRYNMNKALSMCDATLMDKYKQLESKDYYKQICNANIRVQYKCDSCKIDFGVYPYTAVTYGKTCINRTSGKTVRRLVTTCELRNVARTAKIPHGFMIENFQIVDNTDLKDNINIYYE